MKRAHRNFGHDTIFRIATLLILIFPSQACLHASHLAFVVPSRCAKITVESFTRPCSQRMDGRLSCDGVVVTATCIQQPPGVRK